MENFKPPLKQDSITNLHVAMILTSSGSVLPILRHILNFARMYFLGSLVFVLKKMNLYFPPLLIQLQDQYLTVYNALCTGQLTLASGILFLLYGIQDSYCFPVYVLGPMEFHHTYIFIDWNLSEDLGEPTGDFQIPLCPTPFSLV